MSEAREGRTNVCLAESWQWGGLIKTSQRVKNDLHLALLHDYAADVWTVWSKGMAKGRGNVKKCEERVECSNIFPNFDKE